MRTCFHSTLSHVNSRETKLIERSEVHRKVVTSKPTSSCIEIPTLVFFLLLETHNENIAI